MVEKALIIGAGPAGLSAAYYGLKKDIKVKIYEADNIENLPKKPCGEAIPKFALDYIPKEMGKGFLLNKIKRAVFYFNGVFIRELKDMPLLQGYIIDKHLFLKELAEIVMSYGGDIVWDRFIKYDYVMKKSNEFDYILDASGIGIIGRKFLDYKKYKTIPVLQAYAEGNNAVPDDTIVLWGTDKGYAWVFPRGDHFNIGVGGVYRDPKVLYETLDEVIKHFNFKLKSEIRGSSVSVGGPLKKLICGKIRVLGEAAGMVMPTTGEGIRFALAAGKIVFEKDYEKIFWDKYGWKLKNGKKLLDLLLKLKNKTKLARIASDKTYFAFFEGIYSWRKILSVGLKYVLSH